jgi:hypothetical protein
MKNSVTAWIGSITLAAALASPISGPAQQAVAPAPAQGRPGRMAGPNEHHPEIRMAMNHLRMAKGALQRAEHDFAGHREKALDLTDQALKECREALQADKK